MGKITLPGAFWVGLIAFITLALPQIVPGAPWLPEVLLILTAVGKGLEVYVKNQNTQAATRALGDPPEPSHRFSRWFWG